MPRQPVSVPDANPHVAFAASGTPQTTFPFNFPYWEDEDLVVRTRPDEGAVWTIRLDYGVVPASGVASTGYPSGSVVFSAPITNQIVLIRREKTFERIAQFPSGQALDVPSVNRDSNRSLGIDQTLRMELAQALRLPLGSQLPLPSQAVIPENRNGQLLGWDSSGDLELYPVSAVLEGLPAPVSSIGLMQAIAAPVNGDSVLVSEEGRGGVFVFVSSAGGPADGGTTFKANDATTGSWVRRYNGPAYAAWWGASPSASAAVNDAALAAALAAHDDVVILSQDGQTYDIAAPIKLPRWGQTLRGEGTGEAVSGADPGTRLRVVAGFPVAGGGGEQAVFWPQNRYQRIKNFAVDCAAIAKHGLYVEFGVAPLKEGSHGEFENLILWRSDGDGVHCNESPWSNAFKNIRVIHPVGGWGFNFERTTGSTTMVVMERCYAQGVIGGSGLGGFRFNGGLGVTMLGCASDAQEIGPNLSLEGGSSVTAIGFYSELSLRVADVVDTESTLTLIGPRIANYGSDSVAVADVFNINGGFQCVNGRFSGAAAATVFADFGTGARVRWNGNSVRLFEQTLSIHFNSEILADNAIKPSGSTNQRSRFEIREFAPRLGFHEFDHGTTDQRNWEIRVDAGIMSFRTLNAAFGTLTSHLEYNRATSQWSMTGLVDYADDTAAAAGSVPVGGLYRTASAIKIRVA